MPTVKRDNNSFSQSSIPGLCEASMRVVDRSAITTGLQIWVDHQK